MYIPENEPEFWLSFGYTDEQAIYCNSQMIEHDTSSNCQRNG